MKTDIRKFLQAPGKIPTMKEEDDQGLKKEPTQLKTGNSGHAFRFRYNSKNYEVTCDASKTVLEALCSNSTFKGFYEKNNGKDVVIRRENIPRGAVSADFPCCLIKEDELLKIKFIKSGGNSSTEKKPVSCRSLVSDPDNLVVFNIKTTGGETIKMLMKNQALRKAVEYVCVFGIKGETVKRALKRDGRFNGVIFRKHCALSELGSETITNMSNTVDRLDGKEFEIFVLDNQPASLDMDAMQDESGEASPSTPAAPMSPESESVNGNTCQNSAKEQQQKSEKPTENEKKSRPHPIKRIKVQKIPDSQEILQLLRDQYEGLLKQLKQRENLTKPSEVQKLFREEFDKSAQSFSQVKRVKQLMELSNSVCQIRVEGFGMGTGFLLFNRFILTNAHVVGDFDPFTYRLHRPVTAVFEFEDLDMGRRLEVKENIVAYYHGKDDLKQHLDFALLELSDDAKLPDCTELLSTYSPPSAKGGICIVGHPGGGVKQMDPCFIIEKDNVDKAAEKHFAENAEFIHVITQQSMNEKWEQTFSQINYNSCFFHGSSGSPVFNEHCQLIGVHTGGYVYKGIGNKTRSVMEYAFPMFPILVRIIRQCRQKGRADIIQFFQEQNNMKLVLQKAGEQDQ